MKFYIETPDGDMLPETLSDNAYDSWQNLIGCSDMTEASLMIEFWMKEGYSLVEVE